MTLARTSAEVAYGEGHDAIATTDISAAAERFARGLILGVGSESFDLLRSLAGFPVGKATFEAPRQTPAHALTLASDAGIALLLRRIVLEVDTAPPLYRLHPALLPLVQYLRKSA